jgi:hypothetical protein
MGNTSFEEDEKPLDPAVERVRRRLSRLMLIAGLTLGLGIFAVFGAILYKIAATGDKPAPLWQPGDPVPTIERAEMGLPPDARLVSTGFDGRRLVLTWEHAQGNTLVFVDPAGLKVTGKLEIR